MTKTIRVIFFCAAFFSSGTNYASSKSTGMIVFDISNELSVLKALFNASINQVKEKIHNKKFLNEPFNQFEEPFNEFEEWRKENFIPPFLLLVKPEFYREIWDYVLEIKH